MSQVINAFRDSRHVFASQIGDVERDPQAVIGHIDLALRFAHQKSNRAAGPQMLPPELFRHLARPLADIFAPLAIKSSLAIEQPIQRQGGAAVFLVKSPLKSLRSSENRRDIYLADHGGKADGGEQRARIVRHLQGSIVASQLGHGLSAASCEIAHLLLRTSAEAAEARGESFVRFSWTSRLRLRRLRANLPCRPRDRHLGTFPCLLSWASTGPQLLLCWIRSSEG